jgi:hypothetical protein
LPTGLCISQGRRRPWLIRWGLDGKAGQPGAQPLQTLAKKIGAEGEIEAQVNGAALLAQGPVLELTNPLARAFAFVLSLSLIQV